MRSTVAAAAFLVALTGCSGSTTSQLATPTPEPTVGKFEQTWHKPYKNTTCGDWRNHMSEHQRFVMAGDMLINLWQNDGSDAFPPDGKINKFVRGIANACKGAGVKLGLKIPEVAVLLYNIANDIKPPP